MALQDDNGSFARSGHSTKTVLTSPWHHPAEIVNIYVLFPLCRDGLSA